MVNKENVSYYCGDLTLMSLSKTGSDSLVGTHVLSLLKLGVFQNRHVLLQRKDLIPWGGETSSLKVEIKKKTFYKKNIQKFQ